MCLLGTMPKALIIAEKPSVAADLARVLAKAPGMTAFKKEKDYFENDSHIITSAVGHLLEQEMPMKDGKKIGWGFSTLPILPEKMVLKPIAQSADRYKLVAKLLKRADVTEIINACDAGREGELIFRNIIEAVASKKPIKRLWMQSMTNSAILEAWSKLRSNEEMIPLAEAARCRSESDWIIGINSTRALTAFNSRSGGFRLTPVGRVQTPTLAILAKREHEIADFIPRTYYEIHADFGIKAGEYHGRWLDTQFKKDEHDEHKKAERLWDLAQAQAIVAACEGQTGEIKEQTKPTKQIAPLLFDLTSLQREANGRFGYSARRTLQIAQALYEKFKVLTYPRTDSRYLPNDYLGTVSSTLKNFVESSGGKNGQAPGDLAIHAKRILDQQWVKPNKRVFDSSKVSDHFAIIPTGQMPPAGMGEAEQKIFEMVTRRFMAVFHPPAEFDVTTRFTHVKEHVFKSEGKVLRAPGWLTVYGKKAVDEDNEGGKVLVPSQPNEDAEVLHVDFNEESTKPPPRFNEATLLSTMEGAGKLVEDEELAEAMSERGLGTPATRAAIIEGLIMDKYIEREGRDMIVTTKGLELIEELNKLGIVTLCSPELTGQWEYKLRLMEQHQLNRPDFMREIRQLAEQIVDTTKTKAKEAREKAYDDLTATCPFSGGSSFKQTEAYYSCKDPKCKLKVYKNLAGKEFSTEEIRQLIETRSLPMMEGFRSKVGKEFKAALEIQDDFKVHMIFEKGSNGDEIDWNEVPKLCPCPVCAKDGESSDIYILPEAYACKTNIVDKAKCNARLPRELCKKAISEDNARKFFTAGKTDLIAGMISKKNRPFSAFLVCKPGEKRLLSWEFPPREASAGKAKKATGKRAVKKAVAESPEA